ncbi:metallophosphoesterase family protein [Thermovibrio sp.]
MKVGILSDIHGNFHALKEVEKKLNELKVNEVWCLGDVVGYGAFPKECVRWVKENCSLAVLGNHEFAILGYCDLELLNDYAVNSLTWSREMLGEEEVSFLKSLPVQAFKEGFQLVHDTPRAPGSMEYVLSKEDAYGVLLSQKRPVCFFGHTHIPKGYRLWSAEVDEVSLNPLYFRAGRYLVNPGSVGQPRDRDPRASFGVVDLKESSFTLYRVEYDFKAAARAILKAGLPEFLAARLLLGV